MKKKREAASSSVSHSSSSTKTQQAPLMTSQTESPTLLSERKGETMVGWSDMPVELLEKMVGNLDEIVDRIKFGAVCKQWRSALKSSSNLPRVRLPWLLLTPKCYRRNGDMKVEKFYSLSNDKTYHIKHNLNLKGTGWWVTCRCSSDSGWLLMGDKGNRDQVCTLLYNPLTGCQISLPPMHKSVKMVNQWNISFSPDDDSLVVMMTGSCKPRRIYCYRCLLKSPSAPASSWTSFRDFTFDDKSKSKLMFTYHKGYYIISRGERRLTAIVDPDTHKVVSLIHRSLPVKSPRPFQHLVQSSTRDELFLVVGPTMDLSKRFEVFRWDLTDQQKGWSKTRSIGSDTLFMAPKGIIALLNDNSSTFVRENCIVFFDVYVSGQFCLFDIGDNSVQKLPCLWDGNAAYLDAYQDSLWFLPVL